MGKNIFDVRTLPMKGFGSCATVVNAGSFVHRKYTAGRPNTSPESTNHNARVALERMVSPSHDNSDALFGTRIKEVIRQFRALFGRC